LRYDHYEAFGGELSPRLALIFSPIQSLNLLLSYTHSFQAPPFLYRQTNIAGYGSEEGLKTESLDTYALSAVYQPAANQFLQFSLYQEKAKDLIAYDQARKLYLNSGKMTLQGFEGEWKYLGESWLFFLNIATTGYHPPREFGLALAKMSTTFQGTC
jgi:outer membrane receptor protein involved in Fe transport